MEITSFKKNLGAIVILVIVLIAVYSVFCGIADPVSVMASLEILAFALFGLKSYTGIKAKSIEAQLNKEN
jgi:small-conductance mechanosensitive channel